jgi:RNA polymerase sigma factor (sigma-70 family)
MTRRDHADAFRDRWFRELVSNFGSDLRRFLRSRLSDGDQAQDLAHEVYLRLLRMDDVRIIRNPRAFALRLAAHVAHEWRMLARNRMPHGDEALAELIAERANPEESIELDHDVARLSAVLTGLSPKCQTVLLMHRRDGMTYREISGELGLSVAMVKKYLARGLAACNKEMGGVRRAE